MNDISRLFIFLITLCCSMQSFANHPAIDVYGTNEKMATKIMHQLGKELEIYSQYYAPDSRLKAGYQPTQQTKTKTSIIEKIKKMDDFAYVNISIITYPGMTKFITVDLVEQKDTQRVTYLKQFTKKQFKQNIKKDKNLDKLLTLWIEYEAVGLELFLKKEIHAVKHCPAYHCAWGFEHPALKKYQAIFDDGVPKNKQKLIDTLKTAPDEQRRGAAAFLLAHIESGQELIDILTASLKDPSKEVRNNVMRVLGSTLAVVKPICFDIDSVIEALDSPMLTDRNKALVIIMSLSEQPQYAHYVAQHAGKSLMASLKMTQPNLHGMAYMVLQKISGKSYAARDYISWQNWLTVQAKC